MTLSKDIPSSVRLAGFECHVWYRHQPAYCSICKEIGHRSKACPFDGMCRRCRKPGHVAQECSNAWRTGPSAPDAAAPTAGAAQAPLL